MTTASAQIPTDAEAPVAPLPTFDVLPLSRELRETLDEIGYLHPTPVQVSVWEPATRGRDAVIQARTGTGKTAAFGLPMVDQLVRKSIAQPQALVLCPTRELALQVAGEVTRLAKRKDLKITPIYGGAPMDRQVRELSSGTHIVVGTPGRVLDHIRRKTFNVSEVRLVVLDEADEMLSMGFERELSAILEALPTSRQTLLFSATVPPDIERIARNRLKEPEFVTLSGDHIGALSINHFVYMVSADKIGTLIRILETENPESAVVFCNTKDETETVAQGLTQRGYKAEWLNGDLAQGDRERVMTATREGRLRFLVATDVAARGIDISHLTHVINYDFPQDAEAYVHRTGRTGRAGRTGTAISLIMPQDIGGLYLLRLTYKIRPVERQIPTPGELKTRAEADMVGMLAEAFLTQTAHEDDRALARRLLTHDHAERLLAGLLREYLGARPGAPERAAVARRAAPPRYVPPRRDDKASSAPADGDEARPTPRLAESARQDQPASDARPRDERPRDERSRDRGPGRGPSPAGRGRDGDRPSRERRPRSADGRSTEGRPASDGRNAELRGGRRRIESNEADQERILRRPSSNAEGTPLSEWSPPAEEGDDEPLLAPVSRSTAPAAVANATGSGSPASAASPVTLGRSPSAESADVNGTDADYAEVFVSVGRRDGAKAQDLQRAFVDVAGVDRDAIRRIRVRDRHAFVAIKKVDVAGVVAKLNGQPIAGKTATVELARERPTGSAEEGASDGE